MLLQFDICCKILPPFSLWFVGISSYLHQTEGEGEINQRLIQVINIILLGDYKAGRGLCKGTRRIKTIELIV